MKSSKQSLSVDPWHTRRSTMPSCAYAGRMCHRFPRPNFVTWTGEEPFGDHPSAYTQPFRRSRTHRQRQVGKTCTSTSYVDNDLEGRRHAVVRCDGSWFVSSLLIAESDRSIAPKSFYDIDDRGGLPSRIDIGRAVQLVYQRMFSS
jgi:hypothetical protein